MKEIDDSFVNSLVRELLKLFEIIISVVDFYKVHEWLSSDLLSVFVDLAEMLDSVKNMEY